MDNKALKNGTTYEWYNDIEGLTLEAWYDQVTSWDDPYKMNFNGEWHTYKTYKAFENKVNYFVEKYDLELTNQ